LKDDFMSSDENKSKSEVILYIATSLDGYIAREDGSVDWLDSFQASGNDYGYTAFYQQIGAVVMGSATYEQVLELLPDAWAYAPLPSYIVTTRELNTSRHADIHLCQLDEMPNKLASLRQTLAKTEKPHIWLVGGGQLNHAFLQAGWVDKLIISVMPVVLGAGIPLFGAKPHHQHLRLEQSITDVDGVVQLTYSTA
jgi:dihydrofolate reductase